MESWKQIGYRIEIVYLRPDSVDLALRRIAARVLQGGHDVARRDAIRRFKRGWKNLESIYRPMAESWAIYDNSGVSPVLLEQQS
jgi:predicted ABC-type ATPase